MVSQSKLSKHCPRRDEGLSRREVYIHVTKKYPAFALEYKQILTPATHSSLAYVAIGAAKRRPTAISFLPSILILATLITTVLVASVPLATGIMIKSAEMAWKRISL